MIPVPRLSPSMTLTFEQALLFFHRHVESALLRCKWTTHPWGRRNPPGGFPCPRPIGANAWGRKETNAPCFSWPSMDSKVNTPCATWPGRCDLFLDIRLAFWVTMGIPISILGAMLFMPAADINDDYSAGKVQWAFLFLI